MLTFTKSSAGKPGWVKDIEATSFELPWTALPSANVQRAYELGAKRFRSSTVVPVGVRSIVTSSISDRMSTCP